MARFHELEGFVIVAGWGVLEFLGPYAGPIIAAFLAGWLDPIADGDFAAVTRLIEHDHPGYAANPTMSKAELKDRVDSIMRARRAEENRPAPAVVRSLEERLADI